MGVLRGMVAFAAAALSACAAFHGTSHDDAAPAQEGPRPAPVSIFERPWVWTDEQGQAVTFARWKGEPVLLTAIYTQCHATCPRTIEKLRKLYEAFRKQGQAPEFVLVTLDPREDTPGRLRRFKQAEAFPESWHLLTGSAPDTQEVEDLLDIHVLNADSHIVHDARIVIFDAKGMPARTFSGWSLDDET